MFSVRIDILGRAVFKVKLINTYMSRFDRRSRPDESKVPFVEKLFAGRPRCSRAIITRFYFPLVISLRYEYTRIGYGFRLEDDLICLTI